MDSKQHLEEALGKIRNMFEKAESRIEALKPGEKIPATKLAEDVGASFDMTGPTMYPILKVLFDKYPGVEIKRGAHGGIKKLDPNAPVAAPVTVVIDTETV